MTTQTEPVFEAGELVDFVGGTMDGEQGTVESWRYASLRYGDRPADDPRIYYVLIHGHAFSMPCDPRELRRVDL